MSNNTNHQKSLSIQNRERLKGLMIFSGFIVWTILLCETKNVNLILAVPLVMASAVVGSLKMIFGNVII